MKSFLLFPPSELSALLQLSAAVYCRGQLFTQELSADQLCAFSRTMKGRADRNPPVVLFLSTVCWNCAQLLLGGEFIYAVPPCHDSDYSNPT